MPKTSSDSGNIAILLEIDDAEQMTGSEDTQPSKCSKRNSGRGLGRGRARGCGRGRGRGRGVGRRTGADGDGSDPALPSSAPDAE